MGERQKNTRNLHVPQNVNTLLREHSLLPVIWYVGPLEEGSAAPSLVSTLQTPENPSEPPIATK